MHKKNLQNATTNLSSIRKNTEEIHAEHLWNQANTAEFEGNTTASKEIKQLIWIEDTRKSLKK